VLAHVSRASVFAALLTIVTPSFASDKNLPNCQTSSSSLQGSADWTQISPQVSPNVSVFISAVGTWSCYFDSCWIGAQGLDKNPPNVQDTSLLALPTATVGTLIGKIGADPSIRALGATSVFVPWAQGPLFGKMNDLIGAYGDNRAISS
jgi:hypothetical protein